jgi:membrane-bound metal-dependent hydrolase YbcI (DUF457 family)
MMGRTHIVAGVTLQMVVLNVAAQTALKNLDPDAATVVLGGSVITSGIGALVSDLDHPNSRLSQDWWLIGWFFRLFSGQHRTRTHSLRFLILMAVLAGVVAYFATSCFPYAAWIAIGWPVGVASHLLTDAMTVSGVPFFWPNPKCYGILPKPFRIKTQSFAETLFAMGAVVLMALFTYILACVWKIL